MSLLPHHSSSNPRQLSIASRSPVYLHTQRQSKHSAATGRLVAKTRAAAIQSIYKPAHTYTTAREEKSGWVTWNRGGFGNKGKAAARDVRRWGCSCCIYMHHARDARFVMLRVICKWRAALCIYTRWFTRYWILFFFSHVYNLGDESNDHLAKVCSAGIGECRRDSRRADDSPARCRRGGVFPHVHTGEIVSYIYSQLTTFLLSLRSVWITKGSKVVAR